MRRKKHPVQDLKYKKYIIIVTDMIDIYQKCVLLADVISHLSSPQKKITKHSKDFNNSNKKQHHTFFLL